MKNILFIAFLSVFVSSCNDKQKTKNDPKAVAIIDECIEAHGGKNFKNVNVSFDFRKYHVQIQQTDSSFRYERSTKDEEGNTIQDILTNTAFERKINNQTAQLSSADNLKYKEAINSIAYFVLLPFKLKDSAVNLTYLGETTLENQNYDKIEVSFDQEGGGKDHEDVFCYWINKKTHLMDYLAYSNGGPRLRKAIKRDTIDGVIFQNYENYEILDTTVSCDQYDNVFLAGKAKLLSVIEQINYQSNK